LANSLDARLSHARPTDQVFEQTISYLTTPLNEQYPRPWMTKLGNPLGADTFIIGRNQKNGYPVNVVASHQRHLDALFNRNGEGCRALYDEVTGGSPSRTRKNTDRLVFELESLGVNNILETNVICYSTPMSADLNLGPHVGGAKRGEEIFRYLFSSIKPKVLIVHGSGASQQLATILGLDLGPEPSYADQLQAKRIGELLVVVTPSLAPPAYNKWSSWAGSYMKLVAKSVAAHLHLVST
jgi:hypothetical protein